MSLGPRPLPSGDETDIRPIVVGRRRDPGPWIFGALAVLGAVMLFGALDAQRRAATAPATFARSADLGPASSPPPLYIPLYPQTPPPPPPPPPLTTVLTTRPPVVQSSLPVRVIQSLPATTPGTVVSAPAPLAVTPAREPPRQTGDVLVYDRTDQTGGNVIDSGSADAGADQRPATSSAQTASGRPRAVRLRQLAATVPQGTLIPAVLETALDSTRPGFVRALVTRDVRGFDGSQVLIPRGTRLFGEYGADLAAGQNRAFVRWTRLVRPDGTALAVDSPAADALGRAGIQGRVNNHFLERFASAILQSTVNIGVALATRSIGDGAVVVALPGAAQAAGSNPGVQQTQPTLTVDAGATVTVFVAHDLALPAVEAAR